MCCDWSDSRQSRRHWLAGITAAGGAVAAGVVGQPVARAAEGPTAGLGPRDALDFLYAGNKRFAAGESAAPNRDISRLREVAPRQSPFAAFLGCADSRVPIEIVFDLDRGGSSRSTWDSM